MRKYLAAGDRRGALRQFERMDRVLRRELGVGPSEEALALRASLLAAEPTAGPGRPGPRESRRPPRRVPAPVGRDRELGGLDRLLSAGGTGRECTIFVSGVAGIGKSHLLAWLAERAAARGWRTGSGVAAAVEGAWPYAPVLEAFADLCRRHPALLDGLRDEFREEIDRALSGRELDWAVRAGTSGCSWPPPSCSGSPPRHRRPARRRRRARGGRGEPAAAALPGAQRRGRAGAARPRAPARAHARAPGQSAAQPAWGARRR